MHPHCWPCIHVAYHASTLLTMLPHRLPCTHIADHAPTLLTMLPHCFPCTHIAYHAPTFEFCASYGSRSYFVVRQESIPTISLVCMYVCMYLYKSFFNMFRLINVAISRGPRLIKNMKHFQGKDKTYILEYDILVCIGQSCGKYEMYRILYILYFTHDCPLLTNILYFMFYFAVGCTFYLYLGHCYTFLSVFPNGGWVYWPKHVVVIFIQIHTSVIFGKNSCLSIAHPSRRALGNMGTRSVSRGKATRTWRWSRLAPRLKK